MHQEPTRHNRSKDGTSSWTQMYEKDATVSDITGSSLTLFVHILLRSRFQLTELVIIYVTFHNKKGLPFLNFSQSGNLRFLIVSLNDDCGKDRKWEGPTHQGLRLHKSNEHITLPRC